jgi:biopolymer transport protein ExbD
MNFRRSHPSEEPEINFIPLIDVMLVLLIFLMATTTYSQFTELNINLPIGKGAATQFQPQTIKISIDSQNQYFINKQLVSFENPKKLAVLLRKAAGTQHNPIIIIDADSQSAYQSIISVIEASRLAGFSRLTFTTKNQ